MTCFAEFVCCDVIYVPLHSVIVKLFLSMGLLFFAVCGVLFNVLSKGEGKGKAVPLQTRTGPEGSRKLKFPDIVTTAQDGGRFQPYPPAVFTPRKYFWYSFLLEADSTLGP